MWPRLLLVALLIIQAAALVGQAWLVGVTVDEPSHLLSACLYWRGQDKLDPRDMPPMIKIAGGWVPHREQIPIPTDTQAWKDGSEWNSAMEMVARMPIDQVQRVFFRARLPQIIFPLLATLIIFLWVRELVGPWPALAAAFLYAAGPTSLGHGSLFKNDQAAAMGYLLFWYRGWKYWRKPSWPNLAWLAAGTLAGLMAKLSMILLVGLAPLLILATAVYHRRFRFAPAHVAALVVIVYGMTLATSWFEIGRLPEAEITGVMENPQSPSWLKLGANVFRYIPAPKLYWYGIVSLAASNAGGNPVYLLGDYLPAGSRLYFLVAAAVKLTVAMQVLALAGLVWLVFLVIRRRIPGDVLLFLTVPPVLYVALASQSSIQLGVRLILPAVPFLAAWGAFCFYHHGRRWMHASGCALLALLALQSARYYPHGLSFFNLWVGGPENGYPYLVDSNLDWGQDLPDLARWVRENHVKGLRLFYFGTDTPYRLLNEDEFEVVVPPWGPEWVKTNPYVPEPGYYAVSATLLPGHFFAPQFRDYFKAFRDAEPIARAGYSIFIYRFGARPKEPSQAMGPRASE